MSPDGIVAAEHVWKRFRSDRTRALLRDHYLRFTSRLRGETAGWRWALRDIDVRIEPGEAVGLVGANGSGKSTLLKILTGVMYPYAGRVTVTGRVGALIEVRAGVHPDLTGRENTYLFGSLLGLSRADVTRRFDDIVAFAELEDAIDRQVKFFSSGMQMRLGFAVAAFLEPDVLLVDEVLAVGDAAFQQKCLDRMRGVLAEGTTLVFVSHDLEAVEAACRTGIWLDRGEVAVQGPIREVLGAYRSRVEEEASTDDSSGPVHLVSTTAEGATGGPLRSGKPAALAFELRTEMPLQGTFHVGISEGTATPMFTIQTEVDLGTPGEHRVACEVSSLPLPRGRFFAWVGLFDADGRDLLGWRPATAFEVDGPDLLAAPTAVVRRAPLLIESAWALDDEPLDR
ncbi:MAG: ABC transporter ATP-binding protein [Acidimicrobiia bacterium]|nr:ABC transporter ATP-binding protein [Acidimicrobiia bacterium]